MLKLYIVQKYVMAEKALDAVERSKTLPVHEAYIHPGWVNDRSITFEDDNTSSIDLS